jgi:hypothetical protein
LEDIRTLLLDGITTQTSSGVRFCSVQWATRLFPFSDATARYICVLAAADKKIEIREAGLNGLKQELFKSEAAGAQQPPGGPRCLMKQLLDTCARRLVGGGVEVSNWFGWPQSSINAATSISKQRPGVLLPLIPGTRKDGDRYQGQDRSTAQVARPMRSRLSPLAPMWSPMCKPSTPESQARQRPQSSCCWSPRRSWRSSSL